MSLFYRLGGACKYIQNAESWETESEGYGRLRRTDDGEETGSQTLGEKITVDDCYATTTEWARKGTEGVNPQAPDLITSLHRLVDEARTLSKRECPLNC